MIKLNDYDFSGYVTKYNILCSDGRTIAPEAFRDCDENVVPLVSTFDSLLPDVDIGSIMLQHRSDGVYGYGQFNDSPLAKMYQKLVESQTIGNLCIYANKLKEKNHIVTFGVIRAVSIASSGANPEAYIDCIIDKKRIEALELAVKALEERPQGEWIAKTTYDGLSYWICNQCQRPCYDEGHYFCPNCGADMRGKEE